MFSRLKLLVLIALAATALSACVVVPVPAHRAYVVPPPVIVAPYPHYYGRW